MNKITLCLLSCVVFLFLGCAGKKQVSLFPEYDIAAINTRSIEADSVSKETASQLSIVNGALLTTRQELAELQEIQDDISPARLEELEVHLALLTEAFKDMYETLEAIKVMPQVRYKKATPKRPRGTTISSTSAMFGSDEYDLYRRANEVYRNGFYLESRQLFTALIEKYPEGSLTANAAYWIGETHYAEKQYDQAVIAFENAQGYKGSSKADDALYKQALSYYRMGENDISHELFSKLIKRYPASEYVERAKQYIERLAL